MAGIYYGDDGDYEMDLGDVGDWKRRKREIEDEQKMDKFGWFYNVSIFICISILLKTKALATGSSSIS